MPIKLQNLRQLSRLTPRFTASSRPLTQYSSELYNRHLQQSLQNPEDYWGEIASNTIWTKKWDKVMDDSNPPFVKWFVNGELSMCYNAVDRHVDEGFGDQNALIWDSPITGNKHSLQNSQRATNGPQ